MKALFVYTSELDNAAVLAREIASGLGPDVHITTTPVRSAPNPLAGTFDLIIVGGTARSTGLQDWLKSLKPQHCLLMAAYDVRATGRFKRGLTTSIGLTRSMRRLGASSLVLPRTFHEEFENGPLLPGELGRAGRWGRMLGILVGANVPEYRVIPDQPRTWQQRAETRERPTIRL